MTVSNWTGFETYQRLASQFSPPGLERPVREVMIELLTPYAKSMKTDRIGNLYAFMGSGSDHSIMVSAHMDEVALVVRQITYEGLLCVLPQGFIKAESFRDQQVVVLAGQRNIPGTASVQNIDKETAIADIRIDVGAKDRKEVAELGIRLGDRVCFEPKIEALDSDSIAGKSADDRTGLYVLAKIAQRLSKVDIEIPIVLVGTVQEEGIDTFIAWSGAHVAANTLQPILMLGIDTIDAVEEGSANIPPNRPEVNIKDGLGILRGAQDLHPGLADYLLERSVSMEISHQIVPLSATAADYTSIARAHEGVPCAGLGIPILNTHSAREIFNWPTVETAVDFISEILRESKRLVQISNQLS